MTDTDPGEEATLFPKTAGERLREAREAQGLSLAEIAARTRIPIRQLEAIEASNFAALPSITYSVGFAKAYARAVGADEVAIARDVRSQNDQTVRRTDYEAYQITDPSRVPTSGIALAGLAIAVLLLIAVGIWYGTTWFRGGEAAPPAPTAEVTEAPQPAPTTAAPTPVTSGQVVLTATDDVWLRVYDAGGKTLFERTLKPGDRYEVPGDANGPMINVGRPDKLQVTVNGSAVPPLGSGRVAIKDIGISAAALAARATSTPTPAATPSPAAGPHAGHRAGHDGQAAPLNIAAPAAVPGEPAAASGSSTPAPAPAP